MKNKTIKNLTLTAMFLAIGLVLPFFTGQIQQIGNMLLPMHIPVFLCALVCGWKYGLPMAFILPVFRSFLFGMPPLYPTAVSMAFQMFIDVALLNAIPGIILQLLLRPTIMVALDRTKLVPFRRSQKRKSELGAN